MPVAGLFVAFEGIDGCGKTTQAAQFAHWARTNGFRVVTVREPGGTELGEQVRSLLLSHSSGELTGAAEALLYSASRAQLVQSVIKPALARGELVVADRFVDSSLAYQGAGRQLGVAAVRAANELAVDQCWPDVTVLLHLDTGTAAERRRAEGRADDRIEGAGDDFFARVARAYEELAAGEPGRFVTIDASSDPSSVHERVVEAVAPRLERAVAR